MTTLNLLFLFLLGMWLHCKQTWILRNRSRDAEFNYFSFFLIPIPILLIDFVASHWLFIHPCYERHILRFHKTERENWQTRQKEIFFWKIFFLLNWSMTSISFPCWDVSNPNGNQSKAKKQNFRCQKAGLLTKWLWLQREKASPWPIKWKFL